MNEQLIEKLQQINNELQAYPIDFCISTSLSREETNVLLQALTSVKSEPPQTDKLYELSIERYGNDVHLYAQQREGFVEGYAQAIRNLAPIINPTQSVKSESAEEVEKVIQHEAHEYFKRGQLGFEKAADTERAFYKGAKWMHDFANNSEAMKENAIGFIEWASDNKYIRVIGSDSWFSNINGVVEYKSTLKLYNIYLTNKEK